MEVGCIFFVLWLLLYSLSGNKGLCGVPTLPACPFSWEKGLSTGGKIAIGLACVVVFALILLVIYIFCIKRGGNDYDFGLPQDLICEYSFLVTLFPSICFLTFILIIIIPSFVLFACSFMIKVLVTQIFRFWIMDILTNETPVSYTHLTLPTIYSV